MTPQRPGEASFSLHYVLLCPNALEKSLIVTREVQSRAGFRLHKGRHAEGRDSGGNGRVGPRGVVFSEGLNVLGSMGA